MKRIIVILAVVLCICGAAFSAEKQSPISIYKDNYFIGNKDDLKFQISVKYSLFYPFKSGVYFAYTEQAWWDIYKNSSPFREFNHNPEVFWRVDEGDNLFNDSMLGYVDYIQAGPYEHKSNGVDGERSRSLNRYYGQIQLSVGEVLNAGVNLKVWNYYNLASENRDLKKYNGYGEGELFVKLKSSSVQYLDKEKIYVKGGLGTDPSKYWFETGIFFRIITTHVQPRFYIQYFQGYGESLVDYDKKDKQIRAGLLFE